MPFHCYCCCCCFRRRRRRRRRDTVSCGAMVGQHSGSFCREAQQWMPGVPVQSLLDGVSLGDGVAPARASTSPRCRQTVPLSVLPRGLHDWRWAGGSRRYTQQAVLVSRLCSVVPRRVPARQTSRDSSSLSWCRRSSSDAARPATRRSCRRSQCPLLAGPSSLPKLISSKFKYIQLYSLFKEQQPQDN